MLLTNLFRIADFPTSASPIISNLHWRSSPEDIFLKSEIMKKYKIWFWITYVHLRNYVTCLQNKELMKLWLINYELSFEISIAWQVDIISLLAPDWLKQNPSHHALGQWNRLRSILCHQLGKSYLNLICNTWSPQQYKTILYSTIV